MAEDELNDVHLLLREMEQAYPSSDSPTGILQHKEAMHPSSRLGSKGRLRKFESNQKTNMLLKDSRKEYNRLGLKKQVHTFILLVHRKHERETTSGRFPWHKYHEMSIDFSRQEGEDCILPRVKGLHLLLREMSSKILKRPIKDFGTGSSRPSLELLADVTVASHSLPCQ